MKSKKRVGFLVLCIMFVCTTLVEATLTIATFEDPAENSSTPLFKVDFNTERITSEWDDNSHTGLNLNVVYSGTPPYTDAFFTMTDPGGAPGVEYTHGIGGGDTSGGIIKFFNPGDNPATDDPLIQIDFDSATLSPTSLGGVELFGNDVTISGSEIEIGGAILTDEAFSFSFANQVLLPEEGGFTATSAFTSSAVPEPATLALLGFGSLSLILRRRR